MAFIQQQITFNIKVGYILNKNLKVKELLEQNAHMKTIVINHNYFATCVVFKEKMTGSEKWTRIRLHFATIFNMNDEQLGNIYFRSFIGTLTNRFDPNIRIAIRLSSASKIWKTRNLERFPTAFESVRICLSEKSVNSFDSLTTASSVAALPAEENCLKEVPQPAAISVCAAKQIDEGAISKLSDQAIEPSYRAIDPKPADLSRIDPQLADPSSRRPRAIKGSQKSLTSDIASEPPSFPSRNENQYPSETNAFLLPPPGFTHNARKNFMSASQRYLPPHPDNHLPVFSTVFSTKRDVATQTSQSFYCMVPAFCKLRLD